MLVPLGPIHQHFPIQRIICSSYQSVSGAGQGGIDELGLQVQTIFQSKELEPNIFPRQIAFNLIPDIGGIMENQNTVEEQKMINETHKILSDTDIEVAPTCVRVPTFIGHGLSLYVETSSEVDIGEVQEILKKASGVTYIEGNRYPTLSDCQGQDNVLVGRLRPGTNKSSFQCWVVSDNLRKGAALNAVQILENVLSQDWI